jgi:ribosomal protein S18 acetylase RimI-like enzyme
LGYVLAQGCDTEGEILVLGVDPAFRRQGFATQMLRIALTRWHSCGIQRLDLEVRASNIGAQYLYATVGFTQTGMRPRYYADSGEAAVLWTWHAEPAVGESGN